MSDPFPYESSPDEKHQPEHRLQSKNKREPGELFATIATGILLSGALAVVAVLFVWIIVQIVLTLPWS